MLKRLKNIVVLLVLLATAGIVILASGCWPVDYSKIKPAPTNTPETSLPQTSATATATTSTTTTTATTTTEPAVTETTTTVQPPPDDPPEITGYYVPELMICGQEIGVWLIASDDAGIANVMLSVQGPDGSPQGIPPRENGGRWESVYTPEDPGEYTIMARVVDTSGQEVIEVLGTIPAVVDDPPVIVSHNIPQQVYTNVIFYIAVVAEDDNAVDSVVIEIEEDEGIIILKHEDDGWKGWNTFKSDGVYHCTIKATDSRGQVTTLTEMVSSLPAFSP